MYKLFIVNEVTGNYERGDIVIGQDSERLEGYVITSKDDLVKREYLEEVVLGSDQNV